ncbi:LysM peptidoglycan-binding domain-containing protein [Leuconostoc mesenteroides]|uniref:LysM peptidoglycan-binding domain-containing protein n=1 Tax=Leuconostoc mesenteroides TaxID=1245 RepID=UPI00107F0174|nr:LysM peptidoglycan-binding domain-containing protein [Leuconostoc mesenteroides]QXC54283.1 LysM peptidoglycan-binding domain-containing protein [Leuconostoc mesenteroides]TGD35768.1 LysM peptidoglycan-binding domain-containing protein [Leuconostoc mesenteroides]USI46110.1 LysM peptidoglycan-binding domain-containing protein [Leuconostoc mesenteroides]
MGKFFKKTLLTTAAGAAAFVGGHAAASADTVEVQSGDTLSKIAAANNTTVDALAKANGISNKDLILAGSSLEINATQEVSGLSEDGTSYTVQSGDTLSKIAEKTGVDASVLSSLNSLSNTDLVLTGQELSLKASTTQATSSAATTVTAASAQSSSVDTSNLKYIAAADTDNNNFMTLDEYNTYVANGGSTSSAATESSASSASASSAAEDITYIAAADSDNDGYMTMAEYNAYKANGGSTTSSSAQATTSTASSSASTSSASSSTNDNITYVAAADTNNDGYMTMAEYNAYKANGGSTASASSASSSTQTTTTNTTTATTTNVSTGSTTADATINAWNAKRAELGLSPVTISASLTAQAQSRAQSIGTSSNWFSTHMSSGTAEVVANGFGAGSSVINAWYYETGMVNGGHTAFIVNPNFTQAGVGYYNGWIVINAQ